MVSPLKVFDKHFHPHDFDARTVAALIAMCQDAMEIGFKKGLLASASYLRATAADYDQMYEQENSNSKYWGQRPTDRARQTALKEKRDLLNGQAGHISALPTPPYMKE